MRRCIGTLAGLVLFAAYAGADVTMPKTDTIPAAQGAVEVQAIHHASLMLTWNGKHILVDPAPQRDAGADPAAEFTSLPKPDVILVTHGHGDHFNAQILAAVADANTTILAPQKVYDAMPPALQARTHVMANGAETVAAGIPVEAVPAYNTTPDRLKFHPKGEGNGYVLSLGGERIYIAGDSEETPETAHLANIDAAFLPMNLPYTETAEAAAKWVKDLKPRIVYPYHFHNADGTLSDLAAFAKDVGTASEVRVLGWY
jgi:L-ascorbate metabolism protein UlaG (beta-lactamase superfamily)